MVLAGAVLMVLAGTGLEFYGPSLIPVRPGPEFVNAAGGPDLSHVKKITRVKAN